MLSFGERLKMARERRGLTQAQVMRLTNISDKSLSRYETNSTTPDPETIQVLVRLYDVSTDFILGFSPVMGHAPADAVDPANAVALDLFEKLGSLSDDARKKAEEYIEMLKTLEDVKSGGSAVDFEKRA